MAKIYISSTYLDLKDYREAAYKAVRQLGHQAICMEDYVACDERSVDKCLNDVRSCDAYIGILAWRYGFIPKGEDKSITHLEYEAAQEKKIPCFIFMLDEKAPWPPHFISKGQELINRNNFKASLDENHTRVEFNNPENLGKLVAVSFGNKFREKESPKAGSLVHKLCNRHPQFEKFWKFFTGNMEPKCRNPQFVFIHGDVRECPDSFSDRLVKTCLKDFAVEKWGQENGVISSQEIRWPAYGLDLKQQQDELAFNLLNKFDPTSPDELTTAIQLCRLNALARFPLVIINHTIYSSKWGDCAVPLLKWYIETFWNQASWTDQHPVFLVFFKIHYSEDDKTGFLDKLFSKKDKNGKIKDDIKELQANLQNKCSFLLLQELIPATLDDVIDWMTEHHFFENFSARKRKAEEIFERIIKSDGKIHMEKLQKELKKIVSENHPQKEELA